MDIGSLHLLAEIARRGSFAAVARARGVEPSTLSRSIAAVEQELGFRLLQRTTRQMSLTEAGAAYLQRIERLLEDLDAARDEAQTINAGPMGALRLTASVAFGTYKLIPLVADFRAAFPKVDLDLQLTDEPLDLVGERIDLAIRLAPSVRADVVCSRLMPSRYRVCATPGYLAGAPELKQPSDLAQHSAILFSLPDYRSRWLFRDAAGTIEHVPVSGSLQVSSAMAVYAATQQGLGPALLPDWLIGADLASGTLVDVFPDHDAAATSFDTSAWLLYPSRSFLPQKVRVAIDFLRARLGRR